MKIGAPRWGLGIVDVRDLAEAHYQAAFKPNAKDRHITSGHSTDLFEMSQTLLPKYGDDYPIPRRVLPKWLLMLIGPLADKTMTRKTVSRNIGIEWKADNSKSIRELGISYRPMADSMNEFFQQMIDNGKIKKS